MRFCWFVFLLLANVAFTQTAPSSPAGPQKRPALPQAAPGSEAVPSTSKVPPDAAVITIKGLCDQNSPTATRSSEKAGCQTVISRAEFEKLADALQPGMSLQVRRQLATAYPRLVLMAHEAQKRGLDKQPRFQEMMAFARLQILSQQLNRALQEQASQVPEKEIEQYYHDNTAGFEQATLQRIFVPRNKQIEVPKDDKKDTKKESDSQAQQKAAEEAMVAEANKLRARAAGGEDFEKLQKEAFEFAGLKANPPSSNIGKVRRTTLPPSQGSAMDLKPGEVSQVITDPSGHYIYKMVSREVQPLEQVKDEIRNTLQNQKMRDTMQSIQQSATPELNDAYFGASPSMPGPSGVKPKTGGSKESPQPKPPQPK